jgi:uncharacterized membrane protein
MATEQLAPKAVYQNNPFMIAIDGLSLLFKSAYSVAILAIVLCSLAFLAQTAQSIIQFSNSLTEMGPEKQQVPPEQATREFQSMLASIDVSGWVMIVTLIALVIIGVVVIDTIVRGIVDYTAAGLANGKKVTLKQAFQGVMQRFIPYFGLRLLVAIKVLLWSLLLIVPGIIMAVRYSLAGVSFFDKKQSPMAAIDSSIGLTKNAWLTTFASQSFFNMITLGAIELLLMPGTLAILYRQYKQGGDKPSAHVLSWIALMIPIVLAALFLMFFILLVVIFSVVPMPRIK